MPTKKQRAQTALDKDRSKTNYDLITEKKNDNPEVVSRPTALDFKKTEKLKELILQDVRRGRT